MFGFGKKKEAQKDDQLYSPATGEVIELSKVSDPVFAQKMMGDGFAVEPKSGSVVSPVAGVVTVDQGHAVGIKRTDGLEILVHIGIDTVGLNGKPFTSHVKVGDVVAGGDVLTDVDWAQIDEAKLAKSVMVLITNTKDKLADLNVDYGAAEAGAVVGKATAK